MSYDEEKLIFVAGVPRSGTTLVQNILDSHSRIFGGPEFDRIPNIIDLRRKLLTSINMKRIEMFIRREDVDQSIADLIAHYLFPAAQRHHCEYVSEKTPWNILAFKDLIEIFPRARFIFVVRNPLSVIASIKRVGDRAKKKNSFAPDFAKDIGLACYYFEAVLHLMHDLDKRFPRKIFTLKYEALLSDPSAEIHKICAYLGVEFEQAMLSPGEHKHPGEKIMTRDDCWYTMDSYRRNIENSEGEGGRKTIPKSSMAFINRVFIENKTIGDYGYEFSHDPSFSLSKVLGYMKHRAYKKKYDPSVTPLRTMN